MTELFGRLAPGEDLEQARAELRAVYGAMVKAHPAEYPAQANFQIEAKLLRDQITSRARTVLLVLLAASGLVFIIACSNVANLILSRTVRREGELSIRAALGATTGALRRVLLAESLLLCGAGATLGVLSARPMVDILTRYASRFSVRALELTVDSSMLWVGAGLAVVAAVLLAFVPRLPSADASQGMGLSSGSVRITGSTNRRLRIFAVTQIAASFVLLAGASALVKTLISLQSAQTGFDTRHVLAINVPAMSYGKTPQQVVDFYKESIRRIEALPGVTKTAFGIAVPWRDSGTFGPGLQFSGDGHVHTTGEEDPRGQLRTISPGFFAALGVPIIEGRDFNELDGQSKEPVVIVSQTLAQRMFPNQDAINRHVYWTDPVMKFIPGLALRRIALLASLPILTTNTSFLGPSSPSITLLKRVQCLAAASSSTPAQILIRWSRRSLASFATCLPSSRLNVLRRSKTFAPKSSLRIASTLLCSVSLRLSLLPLPWSGSPASWHSQLARGHANSGSGWRLERSRASS